MGRLDALARGIVGDRNSTVVDGAVSRIAARWPDVRSQLVEKGADGSDLIAVDSALSALKTARSHGMNARRAANSLTAAFAPLYPSVGDRIPARVHRLDYLNRSLRLDAAASNWTRATSDAVSARSTWRAARPAVTSAHAGAQADAYTSALNG